jgi:RNA-directed DNA polymerase
VSQYAKQPWINLYTERWLKTPIQETNGELTAREKGTPQGGVVSPLLANIYLHHAFDMWMAAELATVPFERYADDIVIHCKTKEQAKYVLNRIVSRLQAWDLELNPDKTRIVYCKDSNRLGSHTDTKFDFLGYTFQQREVRSKDGKKFASFSPAMSDTARKEKSEQIRDWRLQRRTDLNVQQLAALCNQQVRGWQYYGMYTRAKFLHLLLPINLKLVKWAQRKYRFNKGEAWNWLRGVQRREPDLFAHWKLGLRFA